MANATTTNAEDLQQQSPFLNLPPELRIKIYLYALQNTVTSISSTSFQHISPDKHHSPLIHGSLALLYTSSLIRSESSDAM
jgi:hypothetical protein